MIKALNKDGISVDIQDADSEEFYFCPICTQKLMQKKGEIRAHHYAHYGLKEADYVPCIDTWHSHYDISGWHMDLQRAFPEDCYEVVVEHDGKKHIADVLIGDTVIEFQHSNISYNIFRERTNFYSACGYKVVWVFDLTKEFDEELITVGYQGTQYDWPQPRLMFRKFDHEENPATIYLQMRSYTGKDQKVFERLTKTRDSFKLFRTDLDHSLSVSDFVSCAKIGKLTNDYWEQKEKEEKERTEAEIEISNYRNEIIKNAKPQEETPIIGGKTVYQLWNPKYRWMMIHNLRTHDKRTVWNDGFGRMENWNGRIMSSYQQPDYSGRKWNRYSKKYVLKGCSDPIWKLEYATDEGYNTSEELKLRDILSKHNSGDELLITCSENGKTYIITKKADWLFNCYEVDTMTGVIGEISKTNEVEPLIDLHIWTEI